MRGCAPAANERAGCSLSLSKAVRRAGTGLWVGSGSVSLSSNSGRGSRGGWLFGARLCWLGRRMLGSGLEKSSAPSLSSSLVPVYAPLLAYCPCPCCCCPESKMCGSNCAWLCAGRLLSSISIPCKSRRCKLFVEGQVYGMLDSGLTQVGSSRIQIDHE